MSTQPPKHPSFLEHMLEFTKNYFGLSDSHASGDREQQADKAVMSDQSANSPTLTASPLGEGPQEVVRLLDTSTDLAEEYSKPFNEVGRSAHSIGLVRSDESTANRCSGRIHPGNPLSQPVPDVKCAGQHNQVSEREILRKENSRENVLDSS